MSCRKKTNLKTHKNLINNRTLLIMKQLITIPTCKPLVARYSLGHFNDRGLNSIICFLFVKKVSYSNLFSEPNFHDYIARVFMMKNKLTKAYVTICN